MGRQGSLLQLRSIHARSFIFLSLSAVSLVLTTTKLLRALMVRSLQVRKNDQMIIIENLKETIRDNWKKINAAKATFMALSMEEAALMHEETTTVKTILFVVSRGAPHPFPNWHRMIKRKVPHLGRSLLVSGFLFLCV